MAWAVETIWIVEKNWLLFADQCDQTQTCLLERYLESRVSLSDPGGGGPSFPSVEAYCSLNVPDLWEVRGIV